MAHQNECLPITGGHSVFYGFHQGREHGSRGPNAAARSAGCRQHGSPMSQEAFRPSPVRERKRPWRSEDIKDTIHTVAQRPPGRFLLSGQGKSEDRCHAGSWQVKKMSWQVMPGQKEVMPGHARSKRSHARSLLVIAALLLPFFYQDGHRIADERKGRRTA